MLWIVLSLACVHNAEVSTPESDASSPTKSPTTNTQSEHTLPSKEQNDLGLEPASEVSLQDIDQCIEICIQQTQMRAVSADMIEADCRASCSGQPEPLGTTPLTPLTNSP